MFSKKDFFSAAEKELIAQAIRQAEEKTSGEIRVYAEAKRKGDVVTHATAVFHYLKMNETKERNGVLFYLAYKDRQFAIVGDEGIHRKVGNNFWDDVKKTMGSLFHQGKFTDGLQKGIRMTGEKLKQYFPYSSEDKNELPDEIIIK